MAVTVADLVIKVRSETAGAMAGLGALSAGLVGLGAIAGGVAAASFVKMGMDAQTQLAIVQGLAGVTASQMQVYTSSLEQMSVQLGSSLDESAKGLYYVVSAQFAGADATNVLRYAMMAAKASGADLADVAHGLAGALNAYGAKASDAQKYTDIMTAAVTDGMQTFQEFAHEMGMATATAAAHKVSLIELAAAEASITDKGVPAAAAFMGLAFAITKVMVPADEMGKKVRAAGGSFDDAKWSAMGFVDRLNYLAHAAGITQTEFIKLIGGTRSSKAALDLVNDSGKAYAATLAKMMTQSGITAAAFAVHDKTMAAGFEDVKAAVSVAAFELVKMVSPTVVAYLQNLAGLVGHLPDLFHLLGAAIAFVFGGLGDTISKATTPLTGFESHVHTMGIEVGRATAVLTVHRGMLSQVGATLGGLLLDSYTKTSVRVATFRGTFEGVNTVLVRHQGLLSQLASFIQTVGVPALNFLGAAFSKLPAVINIVANIIIFIKQHMVLFGPILIAVAVIIAVSLVAAFVAWAAAAITAAVATIAATWPVLAIALAIGILITALIWAYQNWGWFRTAVDFTRDSIGRLMPVVGAIMGLLGRLAAMAGNSVGQAFRVLGAIINQVSNTLGFLGNMISGAIGKLGALANAISNIHMPNIHIPGFAGGGITPGGVIMVGEHGPEPVILPAGSRIISNEDTAALMRGASASSGGGWTGPLSGGGGYQGREIVVHSHLYLDGREIIGGLMQPMIDKVRVHTGLRV